MELRRCSWTEHYNQGLAGLKTYTIKSGSKNALIYIYDIGGYAPQNFQGGISSVQR